MACTSLKDEYRKVLVTGGAGFIGSHICEQAIKQGCEVICYDNFVAGKMANVISLMDTGMFTIVDGDVTDGDTLDKWMEGVDVVFHNAASKCTVCRDDPFLDLSTNAWGTFCVASIAIKHGVKRFIHASTGTVKGVNGKAASFYGVSKQAGEKYLEALSGYVDGFNPIILRYHHVYGPRQAGEPNGGVVPIFIERALDGKPLFVHGDGEQLRHFTHVLDVVDANFRAANMGTKSIPVYDVANATGVTINRLAEMVNDYIPCDIVHTEAKQGDIRTFKLKNRMPTTGMIKFEDGMKELFLHCGEYFDTQA